MADRPHGYARYKLNGCRCDTCREAVRRYRRQSVYNRANGVATLVDAGPARHHVAQLRRGGMGLRQVAAAAQIERKVLHALMNGRPDRGSGPSKRIQAETATAILAVPLPTAETLRRKTLVPALGAQRRLQALVANGWSQVKLAELLGLARSNFGRLMREEKVTAEKAAQVHALYRELQDVAPEPATYRERTAITWSREYAAERGWFPPIAWEDDTIDDPAAHPNMTGYDESTVQALLDGQVVAFETVDIAEAARRGRPVRALAEQLGLSYNTLYARIRAKAAA
ncbi:MAG: hypothetical protein HOV67_34675 [Kribbellaceae bacterium]|nr:hypothetical protein [Kribbellaceae bacterium]